MSTNAINSFKAEYQDPVLADATSGKGDTIVGVDEPPPKKKARVGRPRKVKTEQLDGENAPMPPPSPKPLLLPTADTEEESDPRSSPSHFILREMVPRMWIPPGSHLTELPQLNPTPVASSSKLSNVNFTTPVIKNQVSNSNPSEAAHPSAYIDTESQISNVRTALQPASYINTPSRPYLPQATHIFDTASIQIPGDIPPQPLVSDPNGSLPPHWRHYPQQTKPYRASNLGPGRNTDPRQIPSFNIPVLNPSVITPGYALV
jgi:hypothetical protein